MRCSTVKMMYRRNLSHSRRGFSLMELIIAIVVLGILASFAIVGFGAVIDRSTEAKQQQRMQSLMSASRTLYVQKIYQDPSYTWQQAIIDATADLPLYKTNSLSDIAEGVSATGGTNLNTALNAWTLEADTGAAVYSTASSEIVFKVTSGVLYVASSIHSTRAVFGMVSQDKRPYVWAAECSGTSCDAESATTGVPSSGSYSGGGTTTTAVPTYVVGGTGPAGGIIVHVATTPFACGPSLGATCTYLEAAPAGWQTAVGLSAGADPTRLWSGNTSTAVPGGGDVNCMPGCSTDLAIGTGYSNSLRIVAQAGNTAGNTAATLARSYNGGGFSDWFLPSPNELSAMYSQRSVVGGFTTDSYWASAEIPGSWAWDVGFSNGAQYQDPKNSMFRVRPMRSF
jgi:prepilin-type N-terminal cleavage/methylation domain-containing protein